jgi:phosphatidylglycerol:prolipoprotein diacylglycerol transferase
MLPILQIGPLAIQLPGLLLLLGVWVGVTLAERTSPNHGVDPAQLSNLIFIGLVVGVIGARLGYAARYLDVYAASPMSLLALTPVTLAPADGVALAAIACLIYGQRRGLRFWPTLDGLTPGLAVMGVAIGLAHLASGDAFGAPTTLPWAVELWGAHRHPSQVYEILTALAILVLVLRMDRDIYFSGANILAFVAASAGGRLFLEAFRGDSIIVAGGLREAQLVALPVMLAALLGLHLRARSATMPAPADEDEETGQPHTA